MKRACRRWNLRSLLAAHCSNKPLTTASIIALAVGVLSLGPSSGRAQENPPLYKGGVEMNVDALSVENARHEEVMKYLDDLERREDKRHQEQLEASNGHDNPKAREAEERSHENRKKTLEKRRAHENDQHARKTSTIMAAARKSAEQSASDAGAEHQGGNQSNQSTHNPTNERGGQTASRNTEESARPNAGTTPQAAGGSANPQRETAGNRPDARGRQTASRNTGASGGSNAGTTPQATGGSANPQREAAGNRPDARASASQDRTRGASSDTAARGGDRGPTSSAGAGGSPQDRDAASRSGDRGEESSAAPGKHPDDGSIPDRMMKLAAEMDRVTTDIQNNAMTASNEFFKGMAESVGQTAEFLAQKPGTCMPQIMDAVVQYLTNDYNENNEKLYEAAAQSVEEIQKNPAHFFGKHAIDIPLTVAGAAGEIAGARAAQAAGEIAAAGKAGEIAGSTRAAGAAGEIAAAGKAGEAAAEELEAAGRTLKGMAEGMGEFEGFGSFGSGAPDLSKIPKTPGTNPPVNIARAIDKTAGNANCFDVSLATAKGWKTGRHYVALDHNPHVPPPFYDPASNKFVHGDVGTPSEKVLEILRRNYGGARAKDPFHGPYGQKMHQHGVPVLSSQKQIEEALKKAGDGSQGLVFVDSGPKTPGHIFNVRNVEGKIEFWDKQGVPPLQYHEFGNGKLTMSANGATMTMDKNWTRTFFYRLE